ncbi:exosome complex protein Rrp42 [Candidatus Woesearchaeota archaeon]|nr:exosome complex protein Rrp42 [Candidatus Woesearchaeota archaeon]MBW3017206.1 exosome complex protein Rrp42 [Candidatus Woesearchaeota archaeon]
MTTHAGMHVKELVKKGKRQDGRAFDQLREILVEPNAAPNADGSCRVKFGETEVLVGVKLEMGTPYPDTPDEGAMMVGAELLPLSNPKYESGPPGIDSIELARVVDRGIRESKAIDVKALCITPGEKVWMVVIDIAPINSDGNLIDASALATLVALKNTVYPKVDENGKVMREKTDKPLALNADPIAVTINKVEGQLLVDLQEDEEDAIEARLTVTTLPDGTICSLQKGGDVQLSSEEISRIIDLAVEKASELRSKIGG